MPGQAYQQNQCASNSCSMGTHGCALMFHGIGHVCNIRHPAGKHRWDEETARQRSREDSMRSKRWRGPAVGMNDNR